MNQSINQPINQPFNHPPIQAINQSINQTNHPSSSAPSSSSSSAIEHQSSYYSIMITVLLLIHIHPPPPHHHRHHHPHPHPWTSPSLNPVNINQYHPKNCLKPNLSFSKPRCMSCESIDFHRCWGWQQRIQCLQITRSGHWKKTHLGFPANNWAKLKAETAKQQPSFPIKQLSAEKSFQVKWFKVFEVTEKHGLWYKYVNESCFKSEASKHLKMFVLTRFHRKSYHRHPCPNTRSRPGGNILTLDRLTWLNSQSLMPSFLPQHSIHLRNTEHNVFVSKYDLITLW